MPHDAPEPFFHDAAHGIRLYRGDALELLRRAKSEHFDLIFADPPYFLSNGGITCHAGKMVSVETIWIKSAPQSACDSPTWAEIVFVALKELGGEGDLKEINRLVERSPRTKENGTWPSTVRRVVRQSARFEPVSRGRYRLRYESLNALTSSGELQERGAASARGERGLGE
jgi:hypothetical protein